MDNMKELSKEVERINAYSDSIPDYILMMTDDPVKNEQKKELLKFFEWTESDEEMANKMDEELKKKVR